MTKGGIGAGLRRVLTVAAATTGGVMLLAPGGAFAQFYVRQPDVEKGETELEEHGAIYTGPGEDEDLRQSHEVEFSTASPTERS
jgi:hypothetical protein